MDTIKLALLTKDDFTDEYVSWHQAEHTHYYSSTKRSFLKENLLHEFETGRAAGNLFHYGIYHIADNKLIGVIKLGTISLLHKTSDLVVFIGDKNYLGKGLAVEAIKLGNKVAFEVHGLRKLFGGMYRENIASVKAYLKAGWVIEGVLRNQYIEGDKEQDRILVACFNPAIYQDSYYKNGQFSFEEIYPNRLS
jgi:RimJ/RimL family protein N-acetyltransferase